MAEYKGSNLRKQREQMMRDFEQQRKKIQKDSEVKIGKEKFIVQNGNLEASLKESTRKERQAAQTNELLSIEKKKKKKKKRDKAMVSFDMEDEPHNDDDDSNSNSHNGEVSEASSANDMDKKSKKNKKARFGMNPLVNTSFLPDRDREAEERRQREELRKKWLAQQEAMKQESIKITYSYWDGSGHRKEVTCKKGDSISTFLIRCREQIYDLRGVSVDNLLYVKEDLIIPHARGKSGPLFSFDVHDDVRLVNDASVETEESHAGKVVERSCRWEVYDPEKDYGRYSIKDKV
ncbi:XAP5, circadian clock regulator-domain-containing protein [Syncephalis plumigaleata]|nr:XAP5, circadian clock regulator-domain-containing protein [Syncephalis plumigaleata]